MSAPAAIQGDYSDLRVVKSRKVIQVIVELPIEQADAFVQAFGMPRPADGTPVALARIAAPRQQAPEPKVAATAAPRRFSSLAPAQQAGIRCNEPAFWRWLGERHGYHVQNADEAAEVVRDLCRVDSRSQLNTDGAGREAWTDINDEYDLWMCLPA